MYTLRELAELVGGSVKGDPETRIVGYCSLDRPGPDCIAFLERAKEAPKLSGSELGAVVTSEQLAQLYPNAIIDSNPRLAFIRILEHFLKRTAEEPPQGVHRHALVDPEAHVDASAYVGPGAVIEAGAVVGARTQICGACWIGPLAHIGEDCRIGPNVSIYGGMRIGNRVSINGGTVIGAPGFGFVSSKEGHVRFPQVGGVLIEDDVEIGSNCCVDRAGLDDTVIHAGTKIDNLVQIAHGVELGANTIIAAQTGISGGTKIGEWVVIGGQAGFQGHISVGDQSIVAAQSGVFSDLPAKSKVSGYPAKPHNQSLKVLALTFKLPELMEKLRSLEIELEMMRGELQTLRSGKRAQEYPPAGEA